MENSQNNQISIDDVINNVPMVCLKYISCQGVGTSDNVTKLTNYLGNTVGLENQGIYKVFEGYESVINKYIDELILSVDEKGNPLDVDFDQNFNLAQEYSKIHEAATLIKFTKQLDSNSRMPILLMPMRFVEELFTRGYILTVEKINKPE